MFDQRALRFFHFMPRQIVWRWVALGGKLWWYRKARDNVSLYRRVLLSSGCQQVSLPPR